MLVEQEPAPCGVTARGTGSPRWDYGVVVCLLVLYLGVLVHLAWRTGVTVDEPSHLVSSYLYWHGADRLPPRDMPPLIKAVGGWVPRLLGLPIPYDRKDIWEKNHEWWIALVVMERLRERTPKVFFLSRLPLLVFPLATALLLWRWARRLYSPLVAVLLMAAFCLEPTALGHGVLFKNDLAATFGFFLFWYRAWAYWRDPRAPNAAWLGVGLTIAVLAKLSMLVLLPVAPAIVLARHLTLSPKRWRGLALGLVLVVLIPYCGSLAACQFNTRRFRPHEFSRLWADPRISRAFLAASSVFTVIPMPEPLWDGSLSLLLNNQDSSDVFFLGRAVSGGNLLYFVAALALKAPVPLQLLLVGGLFLEAHALWRRRFDVRRLFWILPPLGYVALASLSSFQLGVRLVLPALPLALLVCGRAIEWLLKGRRAILLAILFVLLGGRTVWAFPHYISFFNLWMVTPERGARLLSDSNVDWGQDLRELAGVIHAQGIREFHLSYFGTDCVWAYFSDTEAIPLAPPWNDELAMGPVYRPAPGYYAISATLLAGHMFEPRYRNYFEVFRKMKPIAQAGHSIFVYRVGLPPPPPPGR